jgi:hypothetical protein
MAAIGRNQATVAAAIAQRKKIKTKFSGYVSMVCAGVKTPPIEDRDIWAEALWIVKGSADYERFVAVHDAALAWGKADGRGHIARLMAQNAQLQAEVTELRRALEAQGAEISRREGLLPPAER